MVTYDSISSRKLGSPKNGDWKIWKIINKLRKLPLHTLSKLNVTVVIKRIKLKENKSTLVLYHKLLFYYGINFGQFNSQLSVPEHKGYGICEQTYILC